MAADKTAAPLFDEPNYHSDDDSDLFASAIEPKASQMPSVEKTTSNEVQVVDQTAEEDINLNSDDEAQSENDPLAAMSSVTLSSGNMESPPFEELPVPPPVVKSAFEPKIVPLVKSTITENSSMEPKNKELTNSTEGAAKSSNEPRQEGENYIEILVKNPHKMGEGMSSYLVYTVETKTNIPLFRKQEFSVTRRFSDFLGLHDKLAEKYVHKGRIVPPAPEKNVVGATKVKMAQGSDQVSASDFVERRRAALERYLNRTAYHPSLYVDPDFREFLESDTELPKATSTSALSGAGVLRLFNKVGETVNKMTFKMGESDPWFEEKTQLLEQLDSQLRKLQSSVEALYQHRRELASSTLNLARNLALLSNCEEHSLLSRALAQLSEVEEKMESIHGEQANAEFYILYEMLKDYIGLTGVIKDVFHERVKAYQTWQHAQQTLARKKELAERIEATGRGDKVGIAKDEVLEWEAKVDRSHEEFECISRTIKKELERFEITRVKDFKQAFISYFETLMNIEQQVIKVWEEFIPAAKAIV